MKTRYIIIIDEDEEPMCVSKEGAPGAISVLIIARTPEEAKQVYQNAIDQMDHMGMDKLDAYKNERFQENKKKMGVEFAWPRNQK